MDSNSSKLIWNIQQGIAIVRFNETKILDQRNINAIAAELQEMVEKRAIRQMLINMENVQFLSSVVLGKLMALLKTLKANKGELRLCCIAPSIFEIFKITRMDTMLGIHATESEAVSAFRPGNRQ